MAGEWDVALPIDHTQIGDIPGENRKITTKVKTVLEKEHADLGDGNSGAQHRTGSAVANEGTTTPTKTVDITSGDDALADTAIDRGRLWVDDNFDPPVLKRWDGSAWEVLGTIAAGASPNLAKLISTTAEDTDGGRESQIVFKGTQSGDEETTLGAIEFSHEGASDDQKGQMRVLVNDGDDDDAPSKVALVFKSTGKIDASESLAVLDEDDMASDDADCLSTQQSIKKYVDDSLSLRCRMYLGSDQAIATGTETIVAFDTETYDDDSIGTVGAAAKITPAVAGYYLISVGVMINELANAKTAYARLYKNTTIVNQAQIESGGTETLSMLITDVVYLDADDYVQVKVYHDNGSNRNVDGAARSTWMTLQRVGV